MEWILIIFLLSIPFELWVQRQWGKPYFRGFTVPGFFSMTKIEPGIPLSTCLKRLENAADLFDFETKKITKDEYFFRAIGGDGASSSSIRARFLPFGNIRYLPDEKRLVFAGKLHWYELLILVSFYLLAPGGLNSPSLYFFAGILIILIASLLHINHYRTFRNKLIACLKKEG